MSQYAGDPGPIIWGLRFKATEAYVVGLTRFRGSSENPMKLVQAPAG